MEDNSQEKLVYEYAVIRYVPRVEREEFVNIGLLMVCKRRKWIKAEVYLNPAKLGVFDCCFGSCLGRPYGPIAGRRAVSVAFGSEECMSLHIATASRTYVRPRPHFQQAF